MITGITTVGERKAFSGIVANLAAANVLNKQSVGPMASMIANTSTTDEATAPVHSKSVTS